MHITWPTPHLPPINLYNAPRSYNMKEEPKRAYGMPGAAKRNLYLDQYTWAKLKVIGKGNASEAIRKLVAATP